MTTSAFTQVDFKTFSQHHCDSAVTLRLTYFCWKCFVRTRHVDTNIGKIFVQTQRHVNFMSSICEECVARQNEW